MNQANFLLVTLDRSEMFSIDYCGCCRMTTRHVKSDRGLYCPRCGKFKTKGGNKQTP